MTRDEWRLWRKQGIGGSDIACILGISEWKTKLELFEEKTMEGLPEEKPNFVADRGTRMETPIRSLYEMGEGEDVLPALLQHEHYDFIKCSLDGRFSTKKKIIEIKTVGKDKHEKAKFGEVPACYVPQVQWNMMLSKADECDYISYYDPEWDEKTILASNMIVLTVKPDKDYQAHLLQCAVEFWEQHVLKKKPPIPSDDDYKTLKNAAKIAQKFKSLKAKMEEYAEKMEEAREELIRLAKEDGHPRLVASGIKIQLISKIGSIDYASIPVLQGIDLEKFRKKGSTYFKVG